MIMMFAGDIMRQDTITDIWSRACDMISSQLQRGTAQSGKEHDTTRVCGGLASAAASHESPRLQTAVAAPHLLVTADGSVPCADDPAEQESRVFPLIFAETVAALGCLEASLAAHRRALMMMAAQPSSSARSTTTPAVASQESGSSSPADAAAVASTTGNSTAASITAIAQSTGGSFVLKLFTTFEAPTVALLALLCGTFESVKLCKPSTSKGGNSEVYCVCIGFRGLPQAFEPEADLWPGSSAGACGGGGGGGQSSTAAQFTTALGLAKPLPATVQSAASIGWRPSKLLLSLLSHVSHDLPTHEKALVPLSCISYGECPTFLDAVVWSSRVFAACQTAVIQRNLRLDAEGTTHTQRNRMKKQKRDTAKTWMKTFGMRRLASNNCRLVAQMK